MYGCREFNESLSESLTSLPLERNRSNSFDDIEVFLNLLPKSPRVLMPDNLLLYFFPLFYFY